jgi:hypothetical protein
MTDVLYESYVSLETAKLLKKAGFDLDCIGIYIGDAFIDAGYKNMRNGTNLEMLRAPSLAVAQRWLREEKKIYLHTTGIGPYSAYLDSFAAGGVHLTDWFDSYEEALESGIKKCLTTLVNKHESK